MDLNVLENLPLPGKLLGGSYTGSSLTITGYGATTTRTFFTLSTVVPVSDVSIVGAITGKDYASINHSDTNDAEPAIKCKEAVDIGAVAKTTNEVNAGKKEWEKPKGEKDFFKDFLLKYF